MRTLKLSWSGLKVGATQQQPLLYCEYMCGKSFGKPFGAQEVPQEAEGSMESYYQEPLQLPGLATA